MRPRIGLVGSILRANVRAYAALGSPVAAVVKNDGYGWGAARIAREIDDLVEGYVVADDVEFWALRMRTRRPIRLCSKPPTPRRSRHSARTAVCPTLRRLRRSMQPPRSPQRQIAASPFAIGIIDSAGWAGIRAADAAAFAALCAVHDLRVELWTHITSAARAGATGNAFDSAVAAFRRRARRLRRNR
jgi:alanine racemase